MKFYYNFVGTKQFHVDIFNILVKCPPIFKFPSIRLTSFLQSDCPSFRPFVCLSSCPSVRLSSRSPVCPSVHLSIRLPFCPSLYPPAVSLFFNPSKKRFFVGFFICVFTQFQKSASLSASRFFFIFLLFYYRPESFCLSDCEC